MNTLSDVEVAWMMLIEDSLAEIAAWANKQGDCVVVDENDSQKYPETVYIVSAASIYNDDIEENVC